MGRSRCLAWVSLLLLVPSLFFVSPAAATALHPDVVAFGGRRSLLQASPPLTTPAPAPKAPASPPLTTPAPAPKAPASPPVTTPAPAPKAPASPPVTTPAPAPKAPASTPVTTPAPAPRAPATTPTPTPVAAPGPAPASIFAPAPAPIGVTNSQKRNAIIAAGVIGSVLLVALVLIFCRCRCLKRSKRLPFQRLQMT